MKKFVRGVIPIMLLISLLTGCPGGEYKINDIRIYKDTPVWELAQAVKNQDIKKISQIAERDPKLLDYQDSQYGTTLLFWAVAWEKYDSAEALLKAGADPDIISTYEGGTALYLAAGYSYADSQAKKDPKYVRLLLDYGADPNIGFVGNDHNNMTEIGITPLINSIGCGFEKTKAIVEAGADINYHTPSGMTAAIKALQLMKGARKEVSIEVEIMAYAYYLIVEKAASITEPYSIVINNADSIDAPTHYPVMLLRQCLPALDLEGYKYKMAIIGEFARQGVDYWSAEIPNDTLVQIQKLYPDSWEEYIRRY